MCGSDLLWKLNKNEVFGENCDFYWSFIWKGASWDMVNSCLYISLFDMYFKIKVYMYCVHNHESALNLTMEPISKLKAHLSTTTIKCIVQIFTHYLV